VRRLLLAVLLATASAAAAEPKFEVVSGSAESVTYRELLRDMVAVDGPAFHYGGCPLITKDLPWMPPAVATLRGAKAHCPELRKPRYMSRTGKRKPRDPNVISLLYLGNSLVYYNEIPAMTAAVAAREKRPLHVDSVTRSGVTLDQLWNDTDALKKLWIQQWDYVVIQGGAGSAGPTHNAANFNEYLTRFAAEVRKSGAKPLLYMIWRAPDPVAHNNAALTAAKQNQMDVVPVGIAWMDLIQRGRFKQLDWDGVHPDALGAYLVACTVYSKIYNKPAHGAPFQLRHLAAKSEIYDAALREQTITAEDARAIQDAVWRAVRSH
jgi:lysophospholipase L1-like esterase